MNVEYELGERFYRKRLIFLFLFIAVVFVALLVVPYRMMQHSSSLRAEMTTLVTPLSYQKNVFMRHMAAEVASIRGYLLTQDEGSLERFLQTNPQTELSLSEMHRLAAELEEALEEEIRALRQARRAWVDAYIALPEEDLSPDEYLDLFPVQEQRYEDVLDAMQAFDARFLEATQTRRQAIQRAEELRAWVTLGLALLAIVALGGVLWLVVGLYRAGTHLRRHAEEQAELLQITRGINAATNLGDALQRVADGVARRARAEGALVEQVNFDRDEIEVVAVSGRGLPKLGARAPYPGSLAQKVIESGEAERTTVPKMVEENRPMGQQLGSACPDCHLLVVPLISEGVALGALLLTRGPDGRPFSRDRTRRVRILADMAALILRRLYLFEEARRNQEALRHTTEELRQLNETLEQRVTERTDEVQRLASELTLAEQRERHRLAQLLHDDLQQQLYGLSLHLLTIERRVANAGELPSALLDDLHFSTELIQQTIQMTRHLAVDLSPPVLKGEGLFEALEWLQQQMRERFGMAIDLQNETDRSISEVSIRVFLFQLVRELLFNVVKHADTKHASVTLSEVDDHLLIAVKDEGAGFDPEEVLQPRSGAIGLGLREARDRLRLFNGDLTLSSTPGQGSQVTIKIPSDHVG